MAAQAAQEVAAPRRSFPASNRTSWLWARSRNAAAEQQKNSNLAGRRNAVMERVLWNALGGT
eukprot:2942848-Alexandrium_andersonii.AAC.1